MADGDYERPRTAELARLGRILAEARRRSRKISVSAALPPSAADVPSPGGETVRETASKES